MATRLNRFETYIVNALGLPVTNASASLRRQGATIASGGPNVFTINNPGGIVNGETVTCFKADGTVRDSSSRTVTALSATSITVGGPGFVGTADDDRIVPTTEEPLFEDNEGGEAKSQPLTSNALGLAYGWAELSIADIVCSGGDTPNGPITTRCLFDQMGSGGDIHLINTFPTGSQVFSYINSLRTLSAGDKLREWRNNGAVLMALNHAGQLSLSGGLIGPMTISDALTITTGGITVSAGNLTLTLGSLVLSGVAGLITQSGTVGSNTITAQTNFTHAVTFDGGTSIANTTGFFQNGGGMAYNGRPSFVDLDTTPDVSDGNYFFANNSGATSITNFDLGSPGQMITIQFANANTTIVHDATKIRLAGGVNFNTITAEDTLTLIADTGVPVIWREVARSVNG